MLEDNPWDTMIGLDHMTQTVVTKANSGEAEQKKVQEKEEQKMQEKE